MHHITTPFGRRTLSFGMVAAQVTARDVEDKVEHKWKTFRAIAECKDALGVSDRSLAVLNALLTCLPETALTAGGLVVFPSNKSLSMRTHGMAETTLRRHLAALVDAGLIVRKDSPNGKRYARRGGEGIEAVFGFDLSPILARAEEFHNLAAEMAAERRAATMARERVTIYRRDIGKMIDAGTTCGGGAEWEAYRQAFVALCYRLPRKVTPERVQPLADELHALAADVGRTLEKLTEAQNSDANDGQNGVHIQNSKPENPIEVEPAFQKTQEAKPELKRPSFAIGTILKACPDIAMYDKEDIKSWRDLIATASMVRGMLGISPSAWLEAREVMGEIDAAITIAGILQRAEEIKSPGGYLRSLTEKSRAGKFATAPMIMGLMRKKTITYPELVR